MRRGGILVLSVLATACPEESQISPTDTGAIAPQVDEPAPIADERVEAATTSAALAEAVIPETPEDKRCPNPGWHALPRCLFEDHVYAAGAISGIKNPSLARSAAARRASFAVLGPVEERAQPKMEILQIQICKNDAHALARVASAEVDHEALPACPEAAVKARLPKPKRCPEWIHTGTQILEDHVLAVGAASGIKRRGLARSTAENRARAELGRALGLFEYYKENGRLGSKTSGGTIGMSKIIDHAVCNGISYALAKAERSKT